MLLNSNQFHIIVSLPKNNLALAESVFEIGKVSAIKMHLNVEHRASGNIFGSWEEEKNLIKEVIKKSNCEVGIMPGTKEKMISEPDYEEIKASGISFLDCYNYDLPNWLIENDIPVMSALGKDFTLDEIDFINQSKVSYIEASIIKPEDYGKDLDQTDLKRYETIVKATSKPIFVPSQKKLTPQDIVTLKNIGISGVLLGVISLGATPEEFKNKLPDFLN